MKYYSISLVFITVLTAHVFAQTTNTKGTPTPKDAASEMNSITGDSEPQDSSNISTNKWEIKAGSDNKEVSLSLGPSFFNNNFSILLSAPLNKTTPYSKFNEGNSITGGAAIKVNYQFVFFNNNLDPIEIFKITEACEENPADFGLSKKEECLTTTDDLIEKYKGTSESIKKIINITKRYLEKPIQMYGVTATYSENDYTYFKPDSLEKTNSREYPWAIGAYYSYGNPKRSYIVVVEYEYQEKYKEAKTEIRCPVTADSDFFNCVESFGAHPNQSNNRVSSITLRKRVSSSLAISPKVSFDETTDRLEIGIPFYFFQDKESNFTGGVRVDWNDQTKKSQFSLFVGNKFNLF